MNRGGPAGARAFAEAPGWTCGAVRCEPAGPRFATDERCALVRVLRRRVRAAIVRARQRREGLEMMLDRDSSRERGSRSAREPERTEERPLSCGVCVARDVARLNAMPDA